MNIIDWLLKLLNGEIFASWSGKFGKTRQLKSEEFVMIKKENNKTKVVEFEIKKENSKSWNYIVLHHSLTKDGEVKDSDSIKKWHTGQTGSFNPSDKNYNPYVANPMRDIGYHYIIEKVNNKLEIVEGRPLSMTGGHAKGFNGDNLKFMGIGICVVGNFDREEPNREIYEKVAFLCKYLMIAFNITVDHIIGHRDTYRLLNKPVEKSCPGTLFNLERLRNI